MEYIPSFRDYFQNGSEIATPGLAVNEKYYSHRQKAMTKKINRLSN